MDEEAWEAARESDESLEMGNSPTVIMSHYHEVIRDPGETLKYWVIRPDQPATVGSTGVRAV